MAPIFVFTLPDPNQTGPAPIILTPQHDNQDTLRRLSEAHVIACSITIQGSYDMITATTTRSTTPRASMPSQTSPKSLKSNHAN